MSRFIALIIIVTISFAKILSAQEVELGEAYVIGTTWFFSQANTTVSKMIALDDVGGVHFTYTFGSDALNSNRHISYNFVSEDAEDIGADLEENESQVDNAQRAGYSSIDLIGAGDEQLAVCFYHGFGQAEMAIDFRHGLGAFTQTLFNAPGQTIPLSVKGTIDVNGFAHLVSGTHDMAGNDPTFPLVIWHAEPGGDFEWDVSEPQIIERTTGLSHHIISARESDQVALLWVHNIAGAPAPEDWEGEDAYGMHNDLYLIESADGQEWDYDRPISITRTILPDFEEESAGDTLRPFNNVDAIYAEDVLHAVFSTRGFWMNPQDNGEGLVEDFTTRKSFIWHWDSDSDSLTLVANGWYENEGDPGNMHSNVSRPSIGMDEEGNMYCLFRRVMEVERNDMDYCYGELMLSTSSDQGITWSEPILLTGTLSNDDEEDDFVDENHPSLAERVDENLHISYLLSTESPQMDQAGQMIYQRVAVADLPDAEDLELPIEGFQYHLGRVPIEVKPHTDIIPVEHGIDMAYPNPFNSTTRVVYSLSKPSQVDLAVFDINGNRVSTLFSGERNAGSWEAIWNAESAVSGVYLLRFSAGAYNGTVKLLLIR